MLLVTSAGGKTGQAIVKAFSQAGFPVRAMIRGKTDTSKLTECGAKEVCFGDMINSSDVLGAMQGCDTVYFICPNMNKHEKQFGANVIDAACSLNVDRLIFHSVLHTQVQELEHHWNRLFVEEAIVESGIPYTIFQVGSYYQNMVPGWEKMIKTGIHAMPYKIDVSMSLVDLDEVAEAAVNVLQDRRYEFGIFELCGPIVTVQQKAAVLTEVLGQPIKAETISTRDAVEHAARVGVDEYGQNCMRKMFAHYDEHGLIGSTRILEWILGRPPADFRKFVEKVASL